MLTFIKMTAIMLIIALAMGHFADQPETTTHKTTLAERIERSGA